MIKVMEHLDQDGSSPFEKWFQGLNVAAAVIVTKSLYKLELGNFSNVEGVGSGVYELKIHFGPGYRVYFGEDGKEIVILLCGGIKKRQTKDIEKARLLWKNYKKEKNVRYLCH